MANSVSLSGEEIAKLISDEHGSSITQILNEIPNPLSRLLTLVSLVAAMIVNLTDDELVALQTASELGRLQVDIIQGLYADSDDSEESRH